MSFEPIRVLAVHGVEKHNSNASWQADWKASVKSAIHQIDHAQEVDIEFCPYDDLFDRGHLPVADALEAVAKLSGSFGTSSWQEGKQRRTRSIFSRISDRTRWTSGIVAQWVDNAELRAKTRERLADAIAEYDPHIVAAHSLGSLVCYDTFTDPNSADWIAGRAFISFGSQIANRFVLGNFRAGRVTEVQAEQWFHLYNEHDNIFTAPIHLTSGKFRQVDISFGGALSIDHAAASYLTHDRTVQQVWRPLVETHQSDDGIEFGFESTRSWFEEQLRTPQRRAFLVGINEYANPASNLNGCVNDVYLVSETLQEAGFDSNEIRTLLNDRATAKEILSRLEWLVDGAGPNDELVFYYSGHGAQMPTYNEFEVVDRMLECLVAYDFDWTPEKAVTDKQIYRLYGNLDPNCQFLMVFDCCHSGGMHRQGAARARGIDPPDDIRHRMLKWDPEGGLWLPRDFTPLPGDVASREFTDGMDAHQQGIQSDDPETGTARYFGTDGSTEKLGGACELRVLEPEEYKSRCDAQGHTGPFMPIVYQACQEHELAYEYRHGTSSYGAFTYSLVKQLRANPEITWQAPKEAATAGIEKLGYQQTPIVRGPSAVLSQTIPWVAKSGQRGK